MNLSNLQQCLNCIIQNLALNVHSYSCNYYQGTGDCNCDKYTDDELASKIAQDFGYAFFPLNTT